MLDLIRKKQKTLLIKIIFWVIIAAFVGTIFLVWGKGDRASDPTSAALIINGEKISFESVQRAYSNLYNLYQSLYREQFTPEMERSLGLRRLASDSIIEQTLLAQQAQKRGIKVSRDELVAAIAEIPAFQEDGVFNRERYIQVLNYQRMSPDEFESSQRLQLLINKLMDQIQAGVSISDEEIVTEFRNRNEEVNLSFVTFAPALFESRVSVDDADLQSWFDERRDNFRLPETISLRYLEFAPERYRDQVTFSDADLERHYRRHLDQFEVREQVRAAHILISVDENTEPSLVEQRRTRAQKALQEVKAGKDFAEIARNYSDDPATAAQGGDLGFFPRGAMVESFERAAFALKPGEVSDLVRSPFGFHIIKVTGHVEGGLKPLEDVVDRVKDGLRDEKARQLAIEKAMDAYNLHRRSGDLEAAAQANNLGIKETGFFTREESIDGIGRVPEVTAAAFALPEGELARPVILADKIYLIKIKEKRPSRVPELAEVRSEVDKAYRAEKALDLARQAAEDFLAKAVQAGSLTEQARKDNVRVEETGSFARSFETFIPRIGNSSELASVAFELSEPAVPAPQVFTIGGKYVVAALKEHKPADLSNLDDGTRQELHGALLSRKQQQALDDEVAALREAAKIQITPILANFLER